MSMKLLDYFTDVTDPRIERTKLHKLQDILGICYAQRVLVVGPVEHDAEPSKRAVGDGQLLPVPVEVHDLMPPEDIVGNGEGFAVEDEPHHAVVR